MALAANEGRGDRLALLEAPPGGTFPDPPVLTSTLTLPFGDLSWENFERLCHRLAQRQSTKIEYAARYGRSGQAQGGIDIFARKANGRYEVWQAKRYKTFSAALLRSAIKSFIDGTWASETDVLYLAVQAPLDDVKIQDELETQTKVLAERGVMLKALDGEALTDAVRPHQDLVLSFFGRGWLQAFYGDEVRADVVDRLDGVEFARVREQLARVYETRFTALDQGIVATVTDSTTPARPLSLLGRYAIADVLARERQTEFTGEGARPAAETPAAAESSSAPRLPAAIIREAMRRTPVTQWLADGDQMAIVADAGAGKSTLLRCIALDLLGDQSTFPALSARWADRLPIFVSFAKWARETEARNGEVSLKALVEVTIQPLLTADLAPLINRAIDEQRIVLLVDGLDEWASEQPARLALQTLITYVGAHGVPAIASGRPNGVRKIGGLPQGWKTAELAPLSSGQQRQLASTWFRHHHAGGAKDVAADNAASWAANRFLQELKADGSLAEVAATPLLFMGLLSLAMRNVALPRNRADALRSLILILLESHPTSRATAAGDVKSRFHHAVDPELRQAALGALAFASRRDGGDAGYPRDQAARTIREYLTGDQGLDAAQASAVTSEILAVNAETIGLLIEKAPGDLGFAHASLEEFLGAVHIQSWPFDRLLAFVAEKAGEPRWRNVLRNLVALNTRPNEIESIVLALEGTRLDVLGALNRRMLLAEITFARSAMRATTARRLADQTFAVIDGAGLDDERVQLARIALHGLSDPGLATVIEQHARRWAPRRSAYPGSGVEALRHWPADAELLEILMAALGDEERSSGRAAAASLADKFGGDAQVEARLRRLLTGDSNIQIVLAVIEALVLGWPQADLADILTDCETSRLPAFRSLAVWVKVRRGLHGDADLDDCLRLLENQAPIDFRETHMATEALLLGWPDDPRLIDRCLESLQSRHYVKSLNAETAALYLRACSPARLGVREWILAELDREHPFIGMLWSRDYDFLVPFAAADARIHEKLVATITAGKKLYFERDVRVVIAKLGDTRLRDYAVEQARTQQRATRYWNLASLIDGWAQDPVVQALLAEMRDISDEALDMSVAQVPAFYADKQSARARLLRIARDIPKARRDLLVRAFLELGCTAQDQEVVEALLSGFVFAERRDFEIDALINGFAAHPKIRDLACSKLDLQTTELTPLIVHYGDDSEIRPLVRERLTPASTAIRYAFAASAAVNADRHTVFRSLLETYGSEVDFDLKVQEVVDYCDLRAAEGPYEDLIERLLDEHETHGVDNDDMRAAAFAGLVRLNATGRLNKVPIAGRKTRLGSLYWSSPNSVLCTLLVERWDAVKAAMGDDFVETHLTASEGSPWEALARFVPATGTAWRDFVNWCGRTAKLETGALTALAERAPGSDLLRERVTSLIDGKDRKSLSLTILGAEIARDQFADPALIARLAERAADWGDEYSAIVLAIVAPDHPILAKKSIAAIEMTQHRSYWLAAAYLCALLETPAQVVELILKMADREAYPGQEGQILMTKALVARTVRDQAVASALAALNGDNTLSINSFVAVASILAAAGRLDAEWRSACLTRLQLAHGRVGVPEVVFDVVTDRYRPVSHVLIEILQAPSGL